MKDPLIQLQIKQDQEAFRRNSNVEWQKTFLIYSVDYKLYHNSTINLGNVSLNSEPIILDSSVQPIFNHLIWKFTY